MPDLEPKTHRLESIDFVRGFVMVIMALDHVRDYFHLGTIDPLGPEAPRRCRKTSVQRPTGIKTSPPRAVPCPPRSRVPSSGTRLAGLVAGDARGPIILILL